MKKEMVIKIGSKVKIKGTSITGKVTHIRHTDKNDGQYAYEKKHGMTPRYKIHGKYYGTKSIKHLK